MTPIEHQNLIKANIQAAEAAGDHARAQVLRKAFAPLLAVDLTPKPAKSVGLFQAIDLDAKTVTVKAANQRVAEEYDL